ncbi:MAG: hypothetical protein ACYTG1_12285 [Planctomycetota bacterium]|jgi:hypothetical protein
MHEPARAPGEAIVVPEAVGVGSDGVAVAAVAWLATITSTLIIDLRWLAAALIVGMTAHLAALARARRPLESRRRLVLTERGVSVVPTRRDAAGARPTRWHLFDEVRLERRPPLAGLEGPDRWRLTIVNAYKPTISTYLHSRGTDAAIFAPAIEFEFEAPPAEATRLRDVVRARIEAARRRFSPLRLDDEPAVLPVLRRCPTCRRRLDGASARCPACQRRLDRSMFEVAVTRLRPGLGPRALLATALVIVAVVTLLGQGAAGWPLVAAATAAAGLAWPVLRAGGPTTPGRRRAAARGRLLVTAAGLEDPADGRLLLPWTRIRALRSVQMESGLWRLAAWTAPKRVVLYSPLLFGWTTAPGGGPELDVILESEPRTGRAACREIERRWRTS